MAKRRIYLDPITLECAQHGEYEANAFSDDCPQCQEEWAAGNALPF